MDKQLKTLQVISNFAVNNKVCKLYATFELQMKRNFRNSGLETRPAKSSGMWCFVLVPTILLSYTGMYNVSPTYKLLSLLSIGQLAYSVLFLLFLYMSCLILRESHSAGLAASIFCSTIPIYNFMGHGLIFSLVFSAVTVIPYSLILKTALLRCPKTFTVGEAMIVSQGISLFISSCMITIYERVFVEKFMPGEKVDEETMFIKITVSTVLSTVGVLVTALWQLNDGQRELDVLIGLILLAAVFAATQLYLALGPSYLYTFINYVFRDTDRITLVSFWLALVLAAVVVVVYRTELQLKVTSSTRKSFHLLASLVFITGVLYDPRLLELAAGVVFGVIIFIEALRLSDIEPISSFLQKAFEVYSDEKDVGVFAMTPLYLFAGLASPLVLVPARRGSDVELLSGVLAVGVGDTAASWLGERYGHHYWPGSNRTLEGTMGNICSQIIVVIILNILGVLSCVRCCLLRVGLAALATGLAESQLEQVDNLVLPLLTILSFQFTAFLA